MFENIQPIHTENNEKVRSEENTKGADKTPFDKISQTSLQK